MTHPRPADPDACDDHGHARDELGVEQARARILAAVQPVSGQEDVPLRAALGRVLAGPVRATVNVPPHPNSAMDGYAVAGLELPAQGTRSFRVVGTSWAGRPFGGRAGPGECVRIMTGATLPSGTDTVVMQEHVRAQDGMVVVGPGHRPGQHRREAGEDLRDGEVAVAAGTLLGPAHLGLLASIGVDRVGVLRRPRVAIFSTGDELRSIGEPLGEGQIYDSNRHSLYGMLTRLGLEVIDLGVVRDRREDLGRAIRAAAERADAAIASGGVSEGEADYVVEALRELGEVSLWKVAMKPGKPITFGRVGSCRFFGLPGNPVSAMTTFYQLVQPALRKLAGGADAGPPILLAATCCSPIRRRAGRLQFKRGILALDADGRYTVRPTSHQGAGVLHSMTEANCFIVLPIDQEEVLPGTPVGVQPFAGLV
jgi:molybdopterin molybdotransferase